LQSNVKKIVFADWKIAWMGLDKLKGNDIEKLIPSWWIPGMIKLLMIIVFLRRNFLMESLSFSCFMSMTCWLLVMKRMRFKVSRELSKSFAMKDLGPTKQIICMRIVRERKNGELFMIGRMENCGYPKKYIEEVLERFNMKNSKPVCISHAGHFKLSLKECPTSENEKEEMLKTPYSSAVGTLIYAMVCTRSYIVQVGVMSRFIANLRKEYWQAVKWILKYLKGTYRVYLCFGSGKAMLNGYTYAYMAGDMDSRKSTFSYMMTFARGAVSWQSKLQKCVTLSST